jgi:hypothetical protein
MYSGSVYLAGIWQRVYEEVRFALDSPLAEAVRSEPVSEGAESLFFRENTG